MESTTSPPEVSESDQEHLDEWDKLHSEVRERVMEEERVRSEMDIAKVERIRAKTQIQREAMKRRREINIERFRAQQVEVIRRMTPTQRAEFKQRTNFLKPHQADELQRLESGMPEQLTPPSNTTLATVSEEALRLELARRGGTILPQTTRESMEEHIKETAAALSAESTESSVGPAKPKPQSKKDKKK